MKVWCRRGLQNGALRKRKNSEAGEKEVRFKPGRLLVQKARDEMSCTDNSW